MFCVKPIKCLSIPSLIKKKNSSCCDSSPYFSCFVSSQDISSPLDKNTSTGDLPYQRCLVPNITKDAQHILYYFTTLFILPLDTLLALLSIMCNSVIVVAVLRTRSLQRPSFLLLCSLSMTDVLWATHSLYKNTVFFTVKDSCPKELRGKMDEVAVMLCFFFNSW